MYRRICNSYICLRIQSKNVIFLLHNLRILKSSWIVWVVLTNLGVLNWSQTYWLWIESWTYWVIIKSAQWHSLTGISSHINLPQLRVRSAILKINVLFYLKEASKSEKDTKLFTVISCTFYFVLHEQWHLCHKWTWLYGYSSRKWNILFSFFRLRSSF